MALVSQAVLQPRFITGGWPTEICFASILRKSRGEQISDSLPQKVAVSLEFYGIAGKKHRMLYEIHFVWPDATPYVFETELVPIKA